jgi:uncharacterized membrane protein (UPF0136 family)
VNRNQAAILIYGIIYILMGIQGFAMKGSVMSLMAGGTIGVIEIGFAAYSKNNPSVSYRAAAGLAFLAGLMWLAMPMMPHKNAATPPPSGYSFYPDVVGMILSFVLVAFLLAGHFVARSKSHDGSIDPKA